MKRFVFLIGLGLGIISSVLVLFVCYYALRTPPIDIKKLPDNLISIDSPIGQELFSQSHFKADFETLNKHFISQKRIGYCGVASSVIVLNAIRNKRNYFTQLSVFTDRAREVTEPLKVTFKGMTLIELRDFLKAHGLKTTLFYATGTDLTTFRSIVRKNLSTAGDYLLVNYQRGVLGQEAFGHISPIAAYHDPEDRILLLDVASYKYPPVWVSTAELWRAMDTIVASSGKSRGFLVVQRG